MLIKKNNKSGFTIVELIIVIAVIGILGAIGIVSYSGARQSAARNAADTTAQQVKLKIGEYYTDMGYYPLASVVEGYLRSVNAGTVADDFEAIKAKGGTYVPTSGCNNTSVLCATYVITLPPAVWGGSGASIEVRP